MRATIRHVAERAQVSPKTVSNVLLGRDSIVAPATRDRVMEAVQALAMRTRIVFSYPAHPVHF